MSVIPFPYSASGIHSRNPLGSDSQVFWCSPGIPGVEYESYFFRLLAYYYRVSIVLYVVMLVEQGQGCEVVMASRAMTGFTSRLFAVSATTHGATIHYVVRQCA
jgi:hypothetical protein